MDPFQCPVWLISILETCVDGAASLRLKVPLIWQVPSMACRSGDLKKKGDPQDKKMPSKCENMIQIHTNTYMILLLLHSKEQIRSCPLIDLGWFAGKSTSSIHEKPKDHHEMKREDHPIYKTLHLRRFPMGYRSFYLTPLWVEKPSNRPTAGVPEASRGRAVGQGGNYFFATGWVALPPVPHK